MKEISDVLSAHAEGDERVGELLAASVGRVLLKTAKRGGNWRSQIDEVQLRHIADWLRAALVNGEAWLDNVDDQGRPKKLMKFGSIEQITQEADKAMLRAVQQLSVVQITEGDEELYAELEDGFYLVRLLTPAALDRESGEMQHCIGNGGYDGFLKREGLVYLSLRDRSGKAHATLEIDGSTISEIQGKQNRPPIRAYLDRIIPFARKNGYAVAVPASHLGYVVDVHGDWHEIRSLPEGLTVAGNVDLSKTNIRVLPDRLTVGRSLYLSRTGITTLPEGLEVGGSLDLSDTSISALPEGLEVGGNLYLGGTNITALPEGLKVGGSLNLSGTGVTTLPNGLTVGGNLDLSDTAITVLPRGLTVGGFLILTRTRISVLPEGLTVGSYLILIGTSITDLPDSVEDETKVQCDGGMMSAKEFRQMHGKPEMSEQRAFL